MRAHSAWLLVGLGEGRWAEEVPGREEAPPSHPRSHTTSCPVRSPALALHQPSLEAWDFHHRTGPQVSPQTLVENDDLMNRKTETQKSLSAFPSMRGFSQASGLARAEGS